MRVLFIAALLIGWFGHVSSAQEKDVRRDAVVTAVEKVMPAVVNISTRRQVAQSGLFYDWFRDTWAPFNRQLPPQESAGSGFIIDESGYILSNIHVIEGAHEVWVKFWDDRPAMRATPLVGLPRSDVALLKLDAAGGEKFASVNFAADEDLLLGETVVALGNPLGLGGSVSRGILSAKNRRATSANENLSIPDWLQTDAAINPGNSGGPLINLKGEVIGINVAVSRQGQGIGFAIPIKQVSEALREFFTPEVLSSQWLGLRLKGSRSPFDVLIVDPDSPAAKAGIKSGDQILEINGTKPGTLLDFAQHAQTNSRVLLLRDGKRLTVQPKPIPFDELVEQKLGFILSEVSGNHPARLVIADVQNKGPAESAQLKEGHYVTHISGRPVTSVFDVALALMPNGRGKKIELGVLVPVRRTGFGAAWRQGVVELTIR